MITLKLNRLEQNDIQTISQLIVYFDDEIVKGFWAIERPWLDNKKCESCIPVGEYKLGLWDSTNHPNTFIIKAVPDRTHILIHSGNYVKHSQGCVLLGKNKADINNDGVMDIVNSGKAMEELNDYIRLFMSKGEEAKIIIENQF